MQVRPPSVHECPPPPPPAKISDSPIALILIFYVYFAFWYIYWLCHDLNCRVRMPAMVKLEQYNQHKYCRRFLNVCSFLPTKIGPKLFLLQYILNPGPPSQCHSIFISKMIFHEALVPDAMPFFRVQ